MRHLLRRLGIYLRSRSGPPSPSTSSCRVWRPATPLRPNTIAWRLLAPSRPTCSRRFEVQFGLNTSDPLWLQYLKYLGNLLHGDLGISTTFYPASVGDVIGQNIQWTLVLLTVSVLSQLHHWHADRHRAGVAARLLLR